MGSLTSSMAGSGRDGVGGAKYGVAMSSARAFTPSSAFTEEKTSIGSWLCDDGTDTSLVSSIFLRVYDSDADMQQALTKTTSPPSADPILASENQTRTTKGTL